MWGVFYRAGGLKLTNTRVKNQKKGSDKKKKKKNQMGVFPPMVNPKPFSPAVNWNNRAGRIVLLALKYWIGPVGGKKRREHPGPWKIINDGKLHGLKP